MARSVAFGALVRAHCFSLLLSHFALHCVIHPWSKAMNSIPYDVEFPDEDFSEYEKVYLKLSRAFSHLDKEHWGIHCVCAIQYDAPEGADIVTNIRNAWMQMLVQYPGLRMVPTGAKKHFPRPDEAHILSLSHQTFFVTRHLNAKEVIAEARLEDLPVLHYLPTSMELVLLIQHWRTDGLGACMLLDRLFEILASSTSSYTFKETLQHQPSPGLLAAAGAYAVEDADMKAYARDYIDNFHDKAVNTGGLPFEGSSMTPPAQTTHSDLLFPMNLSDAITMACKARKISVSAAIHTSLAKTVFSYIPDADCQNGFTTVMAVNMRPYLPAPYDSRTHACQTSVVSITPTVRYNDSFLESARALTHDYQTWWNKTFMSALRCIYEYNLAKISSPPTVKVKPPSGVTLSSLGVIEKHLRGEYGPSLSVRKFHFGVSMMTRQMILYAWTFKRHLTLSLSYNEAYYSESMAREVLARVQSHLKAGLQLETQLE
jgi:NRPS condensation-like uncharacterized protein